MNSRNVNTPKVLVIPNNLNSKTKNNTQRSMRSPITNNQQPVIVNRPTRFNTPVATQFNNLNSQTRYRSPTIIKAPNRVFTSQFTDNSPTIINTPTRINLLTNVNSRMRTASNRIIPNNSPISANQRTMMDSANLFNQQTTKRICIQNQQRAAKQPRIIGQSIMHGQAVGQTNMTKLLELNGVKYQITKTDGSQPGTRSSRMAPTPQHNAPKIHMNQQTVIRSGMAAQQKPIQTGTVVKPHVLGNQIVKLPTVECFQAATAEALQNQQTIVGNERVKNERTFLTIPNVSTQSSPVKSIQSSQQVQQNLSPNVQTNTEHQKNTSNIEQVAGPQETFEQQSIVDENKKIAEQKYNYPPHNFELSQFNNEKIVMHQTAEENDGSKLCLQSVLDFASEQGMPQPFEIQV